MRKTMLIVRVEAKRAGERSHTVVIETWWLLGIVPVWQNRRLIEV